MNKTDKTTLSYNLGEMVYFRVFNPIRMQQEAYLHRVVEVSGEALRIQSMYGNRHLVLPCDLIKNTPLARILYGC